MGLYCTDEFRQEIERLRKNSSYANVEQVIIGYYCNGPFAQACTGDLLSDMQGTRFIKKRLAGSGGYRVYVVAVVREQTVYLGYVHPKTGLHGADNITPEKKKAILKELIAARQVGGVIYEVQEDSQRKGKILFSLKSPGNTGNK
jgi:hypothetical protein